MSHAIMERQVSVGEMTYAYLECGSGPAVLCLHGFPDSAWTWRHLLPRLASAGYRAIAPFNRGYAPTSLAPDGRYGLDALVDDVFELVDQVAPGERPVVVGHDWGALIAYAAAVSAPERFSAIVGLAVAPLGEQTLPTFDDHRRRFYIYMFQTAIAEHLVLANDHEFVRHLWELWSPGYDAGEDLAAVREALPTIAEVNAALEYYRALPGIGRSPNGAMAIGPIEPQTPLLYLHGAEDGCNPPAPLATSPLHSAVLIPGVGHFLHLEEPVQVGDLIVEFLQTAAPAVPDITDKEST